MKKTFATAAQKTLHLSKETILKKLEDEMTKGKTIRFAATKQDHIKEAKLADGSKIVIASFDKDNGKTLAMIDHKNIPQTKERTNVQRNLRKTLDKLFAADKLNRSN